MDEKLSHSGRSRGSPTFSGTKLAVYFKGSGYGYGYEFMLLWLSYYFLVKAARKE